MATRPVYKKIMYLKRKKSTYKPHYIPQRDIHTSPNKKKKKSPILTLPLSTRLISNQNYSPFLSRMTKGKSLRGRHLVITRRASIILMIISIITLISQGLWRRRGRRSKAVDACLSACNTSYPSVHLTHLISEIVKTTTKISMHPL